MRRMTSEVLKTSEAWSSVGAYSQTPLQNIIALSAQRNADMWALPPGAQFARARIARYDRPDTGRATGEYYERDRFGELG